MKKYFRIHIILLGNNSWAIRKFTPLIGWRFLDKNDFYWWSYPSCYSIFKTLEEAQEILSKYEKRVIWQTKKTRAKQTRNT